MMLALTSWLALSAGAPFSAVQISPAPGAGEAAAPAGVVLPSGSSDEFERRMMDWKPPASTPPFRASNHNRTGGSAKLDRLSISSRFGWRTDPITGAGRRHAGIDLPSRFGAAVMATAPGIVRIAGWAEDNDDHVVLLFHTGHPNCLPSAADELLAVDAFN